MVTHLLESGQRRKRSFGAAVPSIVLHGAIILAAVHATARAALHPNLTRPAVDTVVFVRPTVARKHSATRQHPVKAGSATADVMRFRPDLSITFPPPRIADVGDAATLVGAVEFGNGLATGAGSSLTSAIGGGVLSSHQVDRAAEPIPGTVTPEYPDILRARDIAGTVVARFVVDTAGRIERGTLRIVSTDDPLFSAAVTKALQHARFRPAMLGGRPVRQLVEQPFSFSLR